MKVVEIHLMDDGTVMVGSPPAAEEAAEMGAEPGADLGAESADMGGKDYLSPVESVDDALDVARELLTGNAEAMDAQADADMDAGFKGGRGEDIG